MTTKSREHQAREAWTTFFGDAPYSPEYNPIEDTCWIPIWVLGELQYAWPQLYSLCLELIKDSGKPGIDPRRYMAVARAACQLAAIPGLDADDYLRLSRVAVGGAWGRIWPETIAQ